MRQTKKFLNQRFNRIDSKIVELLIYSRDARGKRYSMKGIFYGAFWMMYGKYGSRNNYQNLTNSFEAANNLKGYFGGRISQPKSHRRCDV